MSREAFFAKVHLHGWRVLDRNVWSDAWSDPDAALVVVVVPGPPLISCRVTVWRHGGCTCSPARGESFYVYDEALAWSMAYSHLNGSEYGGRTYAELHDDEQADIHH